LSLILYNCFADFPETPSLEKIIRHMKSLFSLLVIFLFCIGLASAQGIEFFKGTWQEALAEAEKQDKIIFVDAYAVWCGPCKRMSREVFTDEAVGAFYNKHFINVKLDMEKGEGLTFRQKYPVSAFPTLYYIDYTGETVQRVRGARPADAFLELGKEVLSKIDRSGQYAEAYEKGERDPELIYNYIQALNRAGKSSLKVTNDYLRDQQDLSSEANLRIIFEGMTEADSRVFDHFTRYRDPIIALESEAAYQEKLLEACRTTVDKAIEFEYRDLIDDAIAKVKKYYPAEAERFELEAEMEYAMALNDGATYAKYARKYGKKVADGDPMILQQLAQDLAINFEENADAMKQAEALAREATRHGDSYEHYLTYANILARNGKRAEAIEAAGQSLELAKAEGERAVQMVERFIQKLKG